MTYYLIGTGNTAHLLAKRMNGAGHVCVGIWGRNPEATASLAKKHHFPQMQSLSEVHDGPDVCLLAVSDSSIADLAKGLAFTTTTLIHFAGSVAISKLAIGAALYGVVWPLYSIRKESLPLERRFPCIIEAVNGDAMVIVKEIAKAISDTAVQLSGEQRQWLHAAAVVSNNFTTYLLGIAAQICAEQNIPFSLLHPIFRQLVKNIETLPPQVLQTGPAKRGDVTTMDHQMKMLEGKPHWQEVYKALSVAIGKDFGAISDSH